MIGKLNHIAIAVPNIKEAAEQYKNIFGAKVSDPVEQPDHGVTTVFIDLGNTKIELLEVLGEGSPIQNFIDKNPKGGMHHICLEVNDINTAIDKLNTHEVSITGTGKPKIGAHGKPVVFLHPKSCNGTLIELEEDPGAPNNPQLFRKFLITTVVSIVIWFIIYSFLNNEGFLMYILKLFYINEVI